jgi:4-amino-4-deoxy-L-arabinose transferase-like glycosyltransferase
MPGKLYVTGKRSGNSRKRTVVLLFLSSLVVRAAIWAILTAWDSPLLYDELSYYERAVGFGNFLTGFLRGGDPALIDRALAYGQLAYGEGVWPPFHSLILSLGLVFGEDPSHARFVVVVLSALTTPLVYALTLRLSTSKAAVCAALLHLFYPSFIAFSYYLWSETTYIFLFVSCAYLTILAIETRNPHRRLRYAGISGCVLGLCGITRAAAAPFFLVIPLSIVLFSGKAPYRVRAASICMVLCGIIVLPWQVVLAVNEERPVFFSTAGGYNLYLGNNPWISDGLGSSWGDGRSKCLVHQSIEEYAELHQVNTDIAARTLALRYIEQDIGKFFTRCFEKLRMLWTYDFFPLRHIFHGGYPPVPDTVVIVVWGVVFFSHMMLVFLVILGLLGKDAEISHKGLILLWVIVGMIPSLVTISMSRLHLPLLAVLLPVAGHSLAHFKLCWQKHFFAAVLLFSLFFLIIFPTFELIMTYYLEPSSYCGAIIKETDQILHSRMVSCEEVVFRFQGYKW